MTMAEVKKGYEALGGKFIEYVEPKQLFTGVWLTGPVPRPFPEKNYPAMIHYRDPEGNLIMDDIPEDQSLVLDTDKGLVVLTGCGHAGLINILTYARQRLCPGAQVYAALGWSVRRASWAQSALPSTWQRASMRATLRSRLVTG
jgi:7,8-dihydropterin-6-yl-methyl-4-(beta-D-ribofuranosyl)aminobenzene 5'-phosphate synthase